MHTKRTNFWKTAIARLQTPAALVAILLAALAVRVDAATATPPPLDPQNMNPQIKPCDDFFEFANGGWLARNPIPPEFSTWASFVELQESNNDILRQILEEAAQHSQALPGTARRKIGDFFASGMNEKAVNEAGVRPLAPEFKRIAAIKSRVELVRAVAHLHSFGVDALFNFTSEQDPKNSQQVIATAYQGGLGLPERDYYTKDDKDSQELRAKYVAHVTKMFLLLGDKPASAAAAAQRVMALETALAKASKTNVELRDPNANYHKLTLDAVEQLTPTWSWKSYLAEIELPNPGEIDVGQPDFFKEVGRLVAATPMRDWKDYLRWHLISDAAPFLSAPFLNENFRFYGTTLTGAKQLKPRWKRCLQATNHTLGEALGKLYVENHFPPEAKARALEMIGNLKTALRERIKTLDWMSDATRVKALAKLESFSVKVGYPDEWRDYSKLRVDRGPYVLNVLRANAFEVKRTLAKIGRPVDRKEWGMTPPTVNAYYNANLNEIVFPAGILQPPFFDPKADDAVNYGGMGAVIGHEMTHGFDDEGRQFDAEGNLKDWWAPEDEKRFTERAQKIIDQFDGYVAIDDLHVNGKLTTGENIADLGGVKIAYAALKMALAGKPAVGLIDGFTPEQRFFLGWAQIWRTNMRPEAMRLQVKTNPHSPARFRANGPLSNIPEFAEAFRCAPSSPMIRPAAEQVRIW